MSMADVQTVMGSLRSDNGDPKSRATLDRYYFGHENSFAVNAALRGVAPPGRLSELQLEEANQMITAYDKVSVPLERDVRVFRALGDRIDKVFPDLKAGDVITDKGFISTSMDPSEAMGQSMLWPAGRMSISVPKGTKVVAYAPEDEILLRPGTRFQVKSIDSNRIGISLEALPPLAKYSPEQARDDQGRWTDGGSGLSGYDALVGMVTPSFTRDERWAIGAYTAAGASRINQMLRGTQRPFSSEEEAINNQQVALLDSAMAKSVVPRDMVVYRGTSLANLGVKSGDDLVGATLIDKAYPSTSTMRDVALARSSMWGSFTKDGALIRINLPKGSNALFPGGGEAEVILPRNTGLRITSYAPPKGGRDVYDNMAILTAELALVKKFDENQPRDDQGQWTDEGGGPIPIAGMDVTPTSKQQAAVLTYVSDDIYNPGHAIALNGPLRAGSALTPAQQTAVSLLDGAMTPLPATTTVYRGAEKDFAGLGATGLRYVDPGYISTTTDFEVAKEFATQAADTGVVYSIQVPKGTPVLDTSKFLPAKVQGQREFILPHGGTVVLKTRYTRPDGNILWMAAYEPPVAKFDPNQPRDDQGQWTDGGGGVGGTASFPATFQAAGLRPGTIADLPKRAVEELKFKEATTSSPELEKAVAAVSAAFKELKDKTGILGDIRDIVGEKVQFLVGDYEPKEAAMTSVTGGGKALILLNSGFDFTTIGQPPGFAYGAVVAAGMTAAGANRDDVMAMEYRYALYHEMGHMLDTASGHEFQAAVIGQIAHAVGNDNAKITSWITDHISPYAATSPAEAAAEVASMYFGGAKLPKELEGVFA